jgi:hypothetical protein
MLMRKVMILMFLVVFCLVPGCNAARKPAPSPDPKPLVVPETSKVGFSKVDLNKAPDVVKNIAGDLAKRETATWLQVNGTSYILVSTGENEKDRRAEITEVIQKIPAQDFVWLDVRARYVGVKEDEQDGPISAVTLNLNDRTISGVGFEITSTDSPAPEAAPAPKATPAPKAAPTPTASPAPTPAPAAPAPATPSPTPTPKPEPKATPAPDNNSEPSQKDQNQNNTPAEKNNRP